MHLRSRGGIEYYTFELLEGVVTHAIFTRKGGVSPDPWKSLNVGGTVGDDPVNVVENRRRAFNAVGLDPDSRYDVWQVHGNEVAIAESPRPSQQPYHRADALITDHTEVSLFMRFADCVPILLADPKHKAVGLVHAGWKGTVNAVVRSTVAEMIHRYNTRPSDLLAAIGPSIGPDHYQIGEDVAALVRQVFAEETNAVLHVIEGQMHFDLWTANRIHLQQEGIHQIEVAGLCTACCVNEFYSHRAEHGRTGRFGALIARKG